MVLFAYVIRQVFADVLLFAYVIHICLRHINCLHNKTRFVFAWILINGNVGLVRCSLTQRHMMYKIFVHHMTLRPQDQPLLPLPFNYKTGLRLDNDWTYKAS